MLKTVILPYEVTQCISILVYINVSLGCGVVVCKQKTNKLILYAKDRYY